MCCVCVCVVFALGFRFLVVGLGLWVFGLVCSLTCCVVACVLLSGGLSSDVETSCGFFQEGHGYSCRLSALVRISHQVDIRSSA